MSKKVHQINKKLKKAKSPAAAQAILQKLRQTDPALYAKVQNQPGN
jgi:hypothetical protein